MSEWYEAKDKDIEISEDGETLDVYVKHNDFGAVYVEIPIKLILKILQPKKLPVDEPDATVEAPKNIIQHTSVRYSEIFKRNAGKSTEA